MKNKLPAEFDALAYRKTLTGEAAFQARTKQAMQPVIEIAGHPYYVNVCWNVLEPHMYMGEWKVRPDINLAKDCYYDDQIDKYIMYYDIKRQEPFDVPDDLISLPKNVVFVKIPNNYESDPVGMAREDECNDPRYYLNEYPIKLYHIAEIIDLKHSPLIEQIQNNLMDLRPLRPPRIVINPDKRGKGRS